VATLLPQQCQKKLYAISLPAIAHISGGAAEQVAGPTQTFNRRRDL
jgi:hypothetical protein